MMLEPGEEYTATLTRDGVGDIHGGKLQEDFNEYQQIVADANTASRTLQKKVEEAADQKAFQDYQGAGGQSRQGTRERFREDECSDTQECG